MAQVTDASVPSSARSGPMTRSGGMSDRAIAWLFISPTILLLLAINIFPLIWTVHMSLTNYKANMGWMKYKSVGIGNYRDILTDSDLWEAMQTTAHFVFWSIFFEVVLGFGLALLINRKFRGHSFWTTIILLPMIVVQKLWPRNLRFISSASPKPRTTSKKMDQKTKCAVVCIASQRSESVRMSR